MRHAGARACSVGLIAASLFTIAPAAECDTALPDPESSSEASVTLSATVFGVNALGATCENKTASRSIFTPLPDPSPGESWDCEALGLDVSAGDIVRLIVRARVPDPPARFTGTASRVALGATVRCVNQTQFVQVIVRLQDENWDCTDAGLPIAGGDIVFSTITGHAE